MNDVVLWVGGILVIALFAMIGIIYGSVIKRLDVLDIIIKRTNGNTPEVLATRITASEKFITELREMKHLKVDPYLPGVVDSLDRRLSRLENK